MKALVQLFLLLPILLYGQGYETPEVNKVVTITGAISNPSIKTINIIALELMERKNYLARLDSNGNFQMRIPMLTAHNNYIRYDNELIQFFVEPGDSVHIEANANDFKNSVQFLGDNEPFNKSLKSFGIVLGRNIEEYKLFTNKIEAPPETYKKVMTSFLAKMNADIDSLSRQIQSKPVAVRWMKARVKYWIYDELFEYGRRHKSQLQVLNTEDQLILDYFDFARGFEGSVLSDLTCSRYYEGFLNEYYSQKLWEPLAPVRQLIDSGYYFDGFKLAIDVHKEKVNDQFSRELLLTRELHEMLKLGIRPSDDVLKIFNQSVKTEVFNEIIQASIPDFGIPEESKTISFLTKLEHIGIVFTEIQKLHKNKVLYIDLWGTWCGPCIKEFPASRKLYEAMDKQLIEFVYLGVESEKEKWEQSIKKYSLHGTHFLLTNDQYGELREQFNVNGIPRYLIIDKSGVVVDENATRPRDQKLKKQLLTLVND